MTPVAWTAPADAARHSQASADLTPPGAAVTQAPASASTIAAVADDFFIQLAGDPAADELALPLAGDSARDDYYAQLAHQRFAVRRGVNHQPMSNNDGVQSPLEADSMLSIEFACPWETLGRGSVFAGHDLHLHWARGDLDLAIARQVAAKA